MVNVDVAVVVPVYNRASLVLDALNCVAGQSLVPRCLLVVDDGSTDGTADAVAEWIQSRRLGFEVVLVRQPRNGGVSAARNRGLAIARDCRYITFLDSDDLWSPRFVERAYAALSANPEAVGATCDRLHVFEESRETQFLDSRPIEPNATCWLFGNDASGIVSATLLATRRVLELDGFNEHLPTGQDTDLFLSLSLLGPWHHAPGCPAIIRRPPQHSQGSATHLSAGHFDNQRRWSQIHEDFIERKGGKRVVPRRLYARTLADRWRRAGHQLMQAGRAAEARRCLRRSLAWRPWRTSVWSQLLKTYSLFRKIRTTDVGRSMDVEGRRDRATAKLPFALR